jgi:hypothetical protein
VFSMTRTQDLKINLLKVNYLRHVDVANFSMNNYDQVARSSFTSMCARVSVSELLYLSNIVEYGRIKSLNGCRLWLSVGERGFSTKVVSFEKGKRHHSQMRITRRRRNVDVFNGSEDMWVFLTIRLFVQLQFLTVSFKFNEWFEFGVSVF